MQKSPLYFIILDPTFLVQKLPSYAMLFSRHIITSHIFLILL